MAFASPPVSSGLPSSNGSPRGVSAMPHIKDLVATPSDIDSNTSIKRLLEMSEQALNQAEMSLSLNRQTLALKDFVRASVILINIISTHRDYVDVKGTRPDLMKTHKRLLNRIHIQHAYFEKLKTDIIADNQRTGVQPTTIWSAAPEPHGAKIHPQTLSGIASPPETTNGRANRPESFHLARTKPPVQPKPKALHGYAIHGGHARSASTNAPDQDLMARLEQLRNPRPSIGQDSRAKAVTVLRPNKPTGPREMPSSQRAKPNISVDTSAQQLPRAPDAIYSPARGSILPDSGTLPSSSSTRMPFHRTGSSASMASTPGALQRTQSNGYFSPPLESPAMAASALPKPKMKPPAGDLITPDDLYKAMKGQGSILMIDMRTRELFNEGHIMTSPIICIEPSIVLRPGISAADISESLVLAPDNDQEIFDKRNEYDMVVLYDQDSAELPRMRRNSEDAVITSLRQILIEYNYDRPLKHPPPKLLQGGLYAWVDLMGPQSLQTITKPSEKRQPLNRDRGSRVGRRPSKYAPARWMPGEVQRWKETISHEEEEKAMSPNFVRTTDDFIQRYPPVSMMRDSTGPPPQDSQPVYGSSHQNDLNSELPTPPARPPPALSRPSHAGLTQEDREETPDTSMTAPAVNFYTGLRNPHAWCYANSVVQSLLASPSFGEELADSKCTDAYRVPRKTDEKIDNPQLLIRIMSNLFHWMSTGKFQVMQAETLMSYSRHVAKQSGSGYAFGGTGQQDADEYMSFLLDQLDDETNIRRDQMNNDEQPKTQGQSLLQAAWEYWTIQLGYNNSIIDRYWRGVELQVTQCLECRTNTYRFSPVVSLALQLSNGMKRVSLEHIIRTTYAGDKIDDFQCNHCVAETGNQKHRTTAVMRTCYPRLPPLLRLSFKCYTETSTKIKTIIDWDLDNVDLSGLGLAPQDRVHRGEVDDTGFLGSFRYQCYAIVLHQGNNISSGHYIAYVRDRRKRSAASAWLRCNDTDVRPMRLSGAGSDLERDQQKSFLPYMALFQRKWD